MGVYNDIEFPATCPSCGAATQLSAQTHVATSANGDRAGRFCLHTYLLGERMRWWPETDARWPAWAARADLVRRPDGDVLECCYTDCLACRAALYAVILFRNVTPVEILDLGLEADWPAEYRR